ncbi:MAG TPA: DUF4037 domain-containing protein, partial [Anaerolineales bacterium]|nr:DUF4037 domain-containing protein [Anaerolineales bacterium]
MPIENWGDSPVPFIPGQVLSERFYHKTVRPLIDRFFSGLPYTAALVGYGSDVLGFDTPRSRDHMWGPRLVLFLAPDQADPIAPALDEIFRRDLPATFLGYPTNFSTPDHDNVRTMAVVEQGPVNHLINITTIPEFIRQELGINLADPLDARAWLSLPQQKLLAVTSGAVFHDDLNFAAVRTQFDFYPHDVWLYTLACQWARIAQEEAFVGRAGEAGDELGSHII